MVVEKGHPSEREKGGKGEGGIPSGTMKGALHCMHALDFSPPAFYMRSIDRLGKKVSSRWTIPRW